MSVFLVVQYSEPDRTVVAEFATREEADANFLEACMMDITVSAKLLVGSVINDYVRDPLVS